MRRSRTEIYDADLLRRLYCEEGLSDNQIGKLLGKDGSNICRARKVLGIEARSPSDRVAKQWENNPERRAAQSEWMKAIRHSDSYLAQTAKLADRYRANPTRWEKLAMDYLSEIGEEFEFQVQFGPFIADFVLRQRAVVIEIDSNHHTIPHIAERDAERTAYLKQEGFDVLRLSAFGERSPRTFLRQFKGLLGQRLD